MQIAYTSLPISSKSTIIWHEQTKCSKLAGYRQIEDNFEAHHNINRRLEITGGHNVLNRVIEAKRPYDSISMIFEGETPIQWSCHVRIVLRDLLGVGPCSTYYQFYFTVFTVNLNQVRSQYKFVPSSV
ncbi:hypothetical protein Glove_661g5 [Diversispora epigaea]|uniref:Uncharacterized protein n=1 Tax=Diversispora epigaea TaxID=1348612 RepID=A0A397GC64_9GLOM|nr:hypothetical protein Glove_661g5 [Diversispora epigaea]